VDSQLQADDAQQVLGSLQRLGADAHRSAPPLANDLTAGGDPTVHAEGVAASGLQARLQLGRTLRWLQWIALTTTFIEVVAWAAGGQFDDLVLSAITGTVALWLIVPRWLAPRGRIVGAAVAASCSLLVAIVPIARILPHQPLFALTSLIAVAIAPP
jgi:hypothetical protein